MSKNPNPGLITDALWYFRDQCLAMEPGTNDEDGGIYAPKYQYHDTRNHIVAVKGPNGDYSVRLADDKAGPGDKAAAFDWTFKDAQSGRYATIIKYGSRVRAAFYARDPRLKGWREVLVQADQDGYAEGYDFTSWSERTPDSTHLWHAHFSCLRRYLNDYGVMNGMLSVLAGETLDTWRAGRSQYGGSGEGNIGGGKEREMFTVELQENGSSYWVSDGIRRRTIRDWDSFVKVDQGDGRPDFVVTSQGQLDNLAGPADFEGDSKVTIDVAGLARELVKNPEFLAAISAGLSTGTVDAMLDEAGRRLQKAED